MLIRTSYLPLSRSMQKWQLCAKRRPSTTLEAIEATSGSFDSMGIIPAELMHSLAGPPSAKVPRRPLCLKPGVGKARSRKYLTSDRTEGDLSTGLTVVHPRRVGSLGPSGC